MAYYDEDKVFDALAIRDTVNHDSNESVSGEYNAKTIIVENGLNQIVTIQLQGARNSTWLNIGAPFAVTAATNIYQTVSDFFPKYRLQAICAISPASGSLSCWIMKARG